MHIQEFIPSVISSSEKMQSFSQTALLQLLRITIAQTGLLSILF